jgi:radical SAM enzyme (TIGR01210 family)
MEDEVAEAGRSVPTQVIVIGGAECRFTCAMCDLWRHTTAAPTPLGAVPAQIRKALSSLHDRIAAGPPPEDRWIKLYNGSNFFDPRSIPPADLSRIAELVAPFGRVIVENHPRLVTAAIPRFRDRCQGRLEVAIGLECTHPEVLARLNKQMTLEDFSRACMTLHGWGIDTRAFVLLGLPWLPLQDALAWCGHAVAFAHEQGVRHVSVIPTRLGNGYLDHLFANGSFAPPHAASLEQAAAAIMQAPRGTTSAGDPQLMTVDLWDWHRLSGHCPTCADIRHDRLATMNRRQQPLPPASKACGCVS